MRVDGHDVFMAKPAREQGLPNQPAEMPFAHPDRGRCDFGEQTFRGYPCHGFPIELLEHVPRFRADESVARGNLSNESIDPSLVAIEARIREVRGEAEWNAENNRHADRDRPHDFSRH